MKIISEGKIPPPQLPWWANQKIKCPHCSTVFQIETEKDIIASGADRKPNGKQWVSIQCPICHSGIVHEEITMRSRRGAI
jgi:uncharacterized protein (DUF2225 family)